jgi:hypothetical protein
VLVGVSVKIEGTALGANTDVEGNFRIGNIPPQSYNVTVSYLGYNRETRYNVVITTGNVNQLNFEMQAEATSLGEVVVAENKSVRVASVETPLSIQNVSVEEIKSNPGGNFDISRVVQALPGVGGTAGTVGGFRNDLIIRGGGPNENVFYLDGVEIPVINHFATQGAAGGPTGILNVSFIEDATLSSSAFNARYDNPLSSVLQFRQRDGSAERFQGNFRLSGTEAALTAEGPLGQKRGKTTFLASARRSYLQFLFKAIDLPIRPDYWDFQYKITHKIDSKTTLTSIGRVDLGHYGGQLDGFGDGTELVLAVNDGAVGHRVFRRHLKVNADRADYGHEDDQRDEKFPDHKCLATKMPRAEARGIVAFLNEKKQVSSGFEA